MRRGRGTRRRSRSRTSSRRRSRTSSRRRLRTWGRRRLRMRCGRRLWARRWRRRGARRRCSLRTNDGRHLRTRRRCKLRTRCRGRLRTRSGSRCGMDPGSRWPRFRCRRGFVWSCGRMGGLGRRPEWWCRAGSDGPGSSTAGMDLGCAAGFSRRPQGRDRARRPWGAAGRPGYRGSRRRMVRRACAARRNDSRAGERRRPAGRGDRRTTVVHRGQQRMVAAGGLLVLGLQAGERRVLRMLIRELLRGGTRGDAALAAIEARHAPWCC